MKLILYDFDKTIYDGDSSFDFFLYCLKVEPVIIIYIPKIIIAIGLYKLKIIKKTRMKEWIFSFIKRIKNVDNIVCKFWDNNSSKIKFFYKGRKHNNDIIISASPEFLLEPIAKEYIVKDLIATRMDKKTGNISGENCFGIEKVNRFLKKYNKSDIYEMYSDSYSDTPLLEIAKHAYIVKKEKIKEIYINSEK